MCFAIFTLIEEELKKKKKNVLWLMSIFNRFDSLHFKTLISKFQFVILLPCAEAGLAGSG